MSRRHKRLDCRQQNANTVIKYSKYKRGKLMRVECETCGKPSLVRSRNRISNRITDVYCICSDPNCGLSFVSSIVFKHTLSPSRKQGLSFVDDYIKNLSSSDKKKLVEQISIDL